MPCAISRTLMARFTNSASSRSFVMLYTSDDADKLGQRIGRQMVNIDRWLRLRPLSDITCTRPNKLLFELRAGRLDRFHVVLRLSIAWERAFNSRFPLQNVKSVACTFLSSAVGSSRG